jgi:putative flippase GtrA
MKAEKRSQWRRWRIFNLVGLVGFSVQLLTLFFLKSVAGLDYRVATACAVQIAVLHNFIWHEHLTWADVVRSFSGGVWSRLLCFHAANGFVSLFGNVALTWAPVKWMRMPYLAANATSVVVCSALNFFVGDRLVFRKRQRERVPALLHCPGKST